MKKHLLAIHISNGIYLHTQCGLSLRALFNSKNIVTEELTEENEKEVCKNCLRIVAPDIYPKEFTDTF